jgi:hypothetical protein
MVMRRISGFLREFRRVCPRLFCGGLCMSFIRCAYLHTTSSVVVHRATVNVGNLGAMRVPPVLSFCERLYSVRSPCPRRGQAAVCVAEWSRGPFRSLHVLRDGRGGRVLAPQARHATIFFS